MRSDRRTLYTFEFITSQSAALVLTKTVGLSLHTYIEEMVGTLNQNLATFVQRCSNAPNTTAFKNTKLPTGNAKYLVQEGRSLE